MVLLFCTALKFFKKKDDKKKSNEMTKFNVTEEFREVNGKVEMNYFQ